MLVYFFKITTKYIMKHVLFSLLLLSSISLKAGHHEKMMDAKDVVKKLMQHSLLVIRRVGPHFMLMI